MALDRLIFAIAGVFILASIALSQIHHVYWLGFSVLTCFRRHSLGFARWPKY